jgi:hypothetical protein
VLISTLAAPAEAGTSAPTASKAVTSFASDAVARTIVPVGTVTTNLTVSARSTLLSDGTVGVAGVVDTLDVVATSVDPTVTAATTEALAGPAIIADATRAKAEIAARLTFLNEFIYFSLYFLFFDLY